VEARIKMGTGYVENALIKLLFRVWAMSAVGWSAVGGVYLLLRYPTHHPSQQFAFAAEMGLG
jgi:hypothetical protein